MDAGIRNFHPEMLRLLYRAFLAAWNDNPISTTLPFDHFEKRIIHKLHIHPGYSLLSMADHEVTGFLLHTMNEFRGRLCAYNGGTGVIPSARGRGLIEKLYATIIPKLREDKIGAALLEVVTTNEKAIHIYEKIGFTIIRQLKCFACRKEKSTASNQRIEIVPAESIRETYSSFWEFEPAFLDQPQHLKYNQPYETILEARMEEELAGYIVFQQHLGRISQLAVHPDHRDHGVGFALLQAAGTQCRDRHLTIMNVPSDASPFILFLEQNGFVNEIDQYEMELII